MPEKLRIKLPSANKNIINNKAIIAQQQATTIRNSYHDVMKIIVRITFSVWSFRSIPFLQEYIKGAIS